MNKCLCEQLNCPHIVTDHKLFQGKGCLSCALMNISESRNIKYGLYSVWQEQWQAERDPDIIKELLSNARTFDQDYIDQFYNNCPNVAKLKLLLRLNNL